MKVVLLLYPKSFYRRDLFPAKDQSRKYFESTEEVEPDVLFAVSSLARLIQYETARNLRARCKEALAVDPTLKNSFE